MSRAEYEAALAASIEEFAPSLIVLAGFMRILSAPFVARYAGRILNIHPSLLPKYPGLDTHRRVLAARESEHGATVHYVTEQLDAGPLIIQGRVPVEPHDDAHSLQARVQAVEHRIYPLAVVGIARAGCAMVKHAPGSTASLCRFRCSTMVPRCIECG